MSKKCFLISFVLLFSLVGSTSAAVKLDTRICWWSDDGTGHDWNEPNNWYTMDRFWDDVDDDNSVDGGANYEPRWYVKVDPNQVPDANTLVLIGKGTPGTMYPEYLHNNPPPFEPIISSGTAVSSFVYLGGGYSLDPNISGGGSQGAVWGNPNDWWWDPCTYHELTMNGGTLNVGEPQAWEGYDTLYGYGYFSGMWAGSSFQIATCGWFESQLGPGNGQGTMYMNDGTVNIGGNLGIGGWEQTIGTLNITGGTININQALACPIYPWGATGRLNMTGGTINARYLYMNNFAYNSGSINIIAGGKIVLSRGDEVDELTDYSNGIGPGGAGGVSLTAYGVGDGEIITDSNYGAAVGKRAALSIDYDVSNEAKTTLLAFVTDPCQAWAPNPPDGAAGVKGPPASLERPVLSWTAGDDANTHDVYFGSRFDDVNDATSTVDPNGVWRGNQDLSDVNYTVGTDLLPLAQYYWRIDEVNVVTVKGQVWDFTVVDLGKASYPSPSNEADEVPTDVTLSWTPGIYVVTHDVYLGTSFDDVNEATTSVDPNGVFMGNQPGNTYDVTDYDPNALAFSTTYYWRIDERDGGTYRGNVWTFTTAAYLTVEDFESYLNNTELYAVWDDGYVNGSGSQIFVETLPDYVHTEDGGTTSLAFEYNNTFKVEGKYAGSHTDANDLSKLAIGSDWTISDAKALVLYFLGKMGNSATENDKMWVELRDTSSNTGVVVYDGDLNDLKVAEWHEWNIDLQDFNDSGVSMADVNSVHIGFGNYYRTGQSDTGGTGTVWFDDIQVWPARCVPAYSYPSGDLTGDCVIDGFDVEAMAGEWLVGDFNTIGFNGTLINYANDIPGWVPAGGQIDGALQIVAAPADVNAFCAESGQTLPAVAIPPLYLNTNAVTFTAWVKRDGAQCDWMTGIIFQRDGDTTAGLCFGNKVLTRNDLAFNWDDLQASWGWDSGLTTPNDQWFFAALVVSQDLVTIYMYDGAWSDNSPSAPAKGYPAEPFEGITYIGMDDHASQARNVIGWIDDARIYDYSLTEAQVHSIVTTGEPNDVYSWYKLDEGSGLIAADSGGGGIIYHPNPSPANYYDDEPQYQQYVNFKDYDYLARNWLKEVLFP